MNLYIKISKVELNQYNKEFLDCITHNSKNSYIKNIFIYTNCKEYRCSINNIKLIYKEKLDDFFIISDSKFTKGPIIYSNPFIKFGEDLFKISENELNKYILVNKDYKIYLNDIKITKSQNEVKFINKEEKSIRLSHINMGIISFTNDSESIIKKPTVSTTPTKRSKKLDVIIVSVDYNDLLILTLQKNKRIFHNITVVTSKTDQKCKEICDKFGVSCIQSDIMYDNNSTFNKGKAINVGINSIENPDLILLLDADIIVENDINLHDLNDKYLYTSERIILPNYDSYLDYINNGVYNKLERDQGLGFYQLFSINNNSINRNNPYPDNSSDASWSDLEFRNKFEFKKNIDRVIHLGDTRKNWKGRKTEEFISEEIRNQILEQNEFNINRYFDRIYCLNLDRRQDRWKKASEQFNRFNINVERWSAIDGNSLNNKLLDYYNPSGLKGEEASILGIPENKNAIGCLLSHLEIIKNAKDNNYNRILIFEDDIILSNNFLEEVKQIEKLDWKLLYLGASQFLWNNIEIKDGHYNCKKTLGTFAYAIDSSIYDDLINIFEKGSQSVDNLLSIIQSKYKNECFTIYPNIVISNVENSDIRYEKNISTYANSMRWDLNMFNNKIKILLVPDVENWAFDNIAKSIIKYNPYPDKIEYTIKYARDIHQKKDSVIFDWDLVFVMWEAERIIPDGDNVIRGCYSAFWLENNFFSEEKISEFFKSSRGGVFVNDFLKDSICKFLPEDYTQTTIHDSTDENKFYPIDNLKEKEFTAIFVGNTNRKIKNYKDIVDICEISGIKLITCTDISNEELINYYNKADICINFSTFEGGPQTFLESSLCEVPMLIRSNNELSKLIPCFKGDDKEDFIRTIKKLKNNREECKEVGRKARNIVLENFTYKKTAKKFADFFLNVLEIDEPNKNLDKKDLSKFLTVFIIRSGDNPNYEDCLSSLNNQSIKFNLIEIKDVAPMSKAFQKMIDNCKTDYYIQVDEDMILFENTIEKIYDRLIITEDNISTVVHMLNDKHLDFDIYGIKGYKHKIMKNYPYNLEIISCEVEQMTRLQNDGFETLMYSEVVGYHSPKWTPELIYERYFDLMEKWKVFKYDWLSELPAKLMEIFKLDPSDINLFALMGSMTSISNESTIRNREKNFLIKDKNFEIIEKMVVSKEEFKFIRNDKKSNTPQVLDKKYVKK
jgi:GR25 family glycosyltransferase involved in LPS biosynthesis